MSEARALVVNCQDLIIDDWEAAAKTMHYREYVHPDYARIQLGKTDLGVRLANC